MRNNIKGIGFVLMAALLWGSSFAVRKMGMNEIGPLMQNAGRFFIGFCFMLVVLGIRYRRRRRNAGKDAGEPAYRSLREQIRAGLIIGLAFSVASLCQQIGLATVTAGETGFITAIYTVEVPFLSWIFLRHRIRVNVWIALVLTVTGLLCITGGGASLSVGMVILFFGSLMYATQILLIDRYIGDADPFLLVTVQVAVGVVMNLVAAGIVHEACDLSMLIAGFPSMAYAGIASLGIANLCQFIGQKYIPTTITAIACSFESVFGLMFGVLLLSESVTILKLAGCGLIFAALIIVQMGWKD